MFMHQRRNDLLRHICWAQRNVTRQASEYSSHPSYNTSLPCGETKEDNEMGGTRNTHEVDVKYGMYTTLFVMPGREITLERRTVLGRRKVD